MTALLTRLRQNYKTIAACRLFAEKLASPTVSIGLAALPPFARKPFTV
ncbi:MAG: hypothetical protein ABL999_11105 [Pyrinomonadaceae bacterium]